jgi:hypothetical protein
VPDFIKMDLEGHEILALAGARETIKACRPKLAIALYHKLEDYWDLPLMLKQLVPEYHFWCRKNAPAAEFVLYATA